MGHVPTFVGFISFEMGRNLLKTNLKPFQNKTQKTDKRLVVLVVLANKAFYCWEGRYSVVQHCLVEALELCSTKLVLKPVHNTTKTCL